MRKAPRSVEEWLYYKLLDSPGFHKFVGNIYKKINGIKDKPHEIFTSSEYLYRPTRSQKFRAYRVLFWDEMRTLIGLPRKSEKIVGRK
ncbi:YNL211C [Zygosaccharomyces parabailii]|uniref:ZYBA0S04-00958g1_1 n=1 Tax=Zygosaccharomyces bailii (strain CLIB 213 / ATCC 58445 / CBS 680 / BCRC 21525 / NBRC 1098 / NCYC 1416 / NRRL Y-2227) TaxID=1333698 RepID=A0A8J2T8L9_ZYGB2|nr:YNL211C [Zygosaccharomyces parabailii]CDF89300.1 ZYBA0S04-00958g1_1 [Zygosaccharomyces bailii CLIB 213]SJM85662.1 uncharacterized protein ZBIST_2375 [Zygosaccharomyces bailii]